MKKISAFINNIVDSISFRNVSFIILTALLLIYSFFDITTSTQTSHNNYDRTISKIALLCIIGYCALYSITFFLICLKKKKRILSYILSNNYFIFLLSFIVIALSSIASVVINKQNITVLSTAFVYYALFVFLSLYFKLITYEDKYSKQLALYSLLVIFFFYYFFLVFYFFYIIGVPTSSGTFRIPTLSHIFFPASLLPIIRMFLKEKIFIIYIIFAPLVIICNKASVFIIFFVFVIFDLIFANKSPRVKKFVNILLVAGGVCFVGLLLIANAFPGTLLYNKFSFKAVFIDSGRIQNWKNICSNIPKFSLMNFVFGKGSGATLLINKGVAAHNDFIEYFYNFGLFGLLGIFILLFYFIKNLFDKPTPYKISNNFLLLFYVGSIMFVSALFTNNNILLSLSMSNLDINKKKKVRIVNPDNSIINNTECTECHACDSVCSKNAITFNSTFRSPYLYPQIDKNLCVNCKKCDSVCQIFKNQAVFKNEITSIIYSEHNIEKTSSSSGGFCYSFALYFIKNKGIVYTSIFDKNTKSVKFHRFVSPDDLNRIKGSKYVKSKIGNSFGHIRKDLLNNKKVLFIGTACEISGLLLFLNKKYNNLTTISLLCGGTLPQELFKLYLEELQNKFNKKIVDINFRTKIRNDNWFNTSVAFSDGSKKLLKEKDNAYIKILGSSYRRPSCVSCNDKIDQIRFNSNITVGDYHRTSNKTPFSSLVFIKERNHLLDNFLEDKKTRYKVIDTKTAISSAIYKKENENKSKIEYELFFNDFKNNGSNYAFKKHIYSTFDLRKKISYNIPKKIKRLINRV